MLLFYPFRSAATLLVCTLFTGFSGFCQITYFHQNFTKTTGLINPQPDSGQFSHIILTSPALSYHKFHKGYIELVRTQQDSASGGIIRIMHATPFLPTPKTLIIRIKMSAELIQSNSVNAIYLYSGENFDPVNNSFPGNGNMFGRCSINFLGNAFNVKDPETQITSDSINLKKVVTLTWVLNNSDKTFGYDVSANKKDEIVNPGSYDLWVDDKPVIKSTAAYPGSSAYSATKLSNFEIRFRNGLGRIRIYEMSITDGMQPMELSEAVIMPNPALGNSFMLGGKNIDTKSLTLTDIAGRPRSFRAFARGIDRFEIVPDLPLSAGMYFLYLHIQDNRRMYAKFLVE